MFILRDENCCVDTCHYLCLSHQPTSLMRKSEKFSVSFPKQKILMELLCQSSPATFEATCKHEAIYVSDLKATAILQVSGRR